MTLDDAVRLVADEWEPYDPRIAVRGTGLLARANDGHVLEAPDLQVAQRVGDLAHEESQSARLALAMATRAVRHGSVCVDLERAHRVLSEADSEIDSGAAWPEPTRWLEEVAASRLAEHGVLRIDGGQVYLDRYWRLERELCADLVARAAHPLEVDHPRLTDGIAALGQEVFSDEQKRAAELAVAQRTTVLTGGPGTGKTTTIARILWLLADQAAGHGDTRIRVALAAPTGKAAARLTQAVTEAFATRVPSPSVPVDRLEATTLHRLLGWRSDNSTRFRHHRHNRLPHDVVIVDECSMVDLSMMARLVEAVRPQARLILVGDPQQLTSVGAGAVLADLVEGIKGSSSPDRVAKLSHNHRSGEQVGINRLAQALREGDADGVLDTLNSGHPDLVFDRTDDPSDAIRNSCLQPARELVRTASRGEESAALAALAEHRLLCAHREGPTGVRWWNRRIEQWLAETVPGGLQHPWFAGQPILVTRNDPALGLNNGDAGVIVAREDGRLRACFETASGTRDYAPSRLGEVETMHAMTIHKSQGSQARAVTVLLPPPESRLLTRELFYTAVTRAQVSLRVIGTEESVRAATENVADRATGLAARLSAALDDA